MKKLFSVIFALTLFGCQQKSQPIPESAWVNNNIGVGQMGSFEYDSAYRTFNEIHKTYPKHITFHQNWIIATINRQQSGDENIAMQELLTLQLNDSSNLVNRYLLGLLYFNQGDCTAANEHFKFVVENDVTDAYANYFLGQCLLQQGEIKKAHEQFIKTIEVDPYLRSAYYGAFMTAQRLNIATDAEKYLLDYQRMELNPQSRLAEIKYTRMGPKAMAQTSPSDAQAEQTTKLEPLDNPFDEGRLINHSFIDKKWTTVNFNQPEFWVSENDEVNVFHLINNQVQLDRKIPAIGLTKSDQISITDINQDGLIDGYITTHGAADRLFINEDDQWKFVENPVDGNALPQSTQVKTADLDHDGDLDIISIDTTGALNIVTNNGDSTFRLLNIDSIDKNQNSNFIDAALIDFDGDRDLDIVLIKKDQMALLVNDRMWAYKLRKHDLNFKANQLDTRYAKNGSTTIYVSDQNQTLNIASYDSFTDQFNWQAYTTSDSFSSFSINDFDGNGIDDWLFFSSTKATILDSTDLSTKQSIKFDTPQQNFILLASLKGPELFTMSKDSITHWPSSHNRHGFLKLSFTGKEQAADSMRSNALGLGTEYIIHNKKQHKKQLYLSQTHHAFQSIGAINTASFIPKGESGEIDFISLQWSDGVYQTELGLTSGTDHKITETQRQLSSCPVLFMELDGQFEFLTDVMGVGASGFLVEKDVYAAPRDWEFLLLEQDHIDRSDLNFLVTEPMEETMFLDALAMKVYETDASYKAVLDERMAVKESQPTGDLMFYKEQWFPNKIISQDGSDSLNLNQAIDADPLPVGELDLRFLGRLQEPQVHNMTFEHSIEGDMILMLNGWVEYGYSQTSFAAWQAGESLQYPSLDAKIDGQWVTLLDNWGFPAGMPKMAAIEFKMPEGVSTYELRIRSTQEVYIDQISLAKRVYPEYTVENLNLISAKQSIIGFPKRDNGPFRFPIYNFNKLSPFEDTRHMTGAYTQLGPVDPLVEQKDNAIAIVSGGEAITFQFSKPADKTPDGKQRFYVMEFFGWAKDMDMMTQYDKYIEPLPQSGEISEEAKALNHRFNTRFMSGK